MPLRKRRISGALLMAPLLTWLPGCASTPEPDARYRPAENVLEVIAVLRRHVPDDTYRFEPGQDFTGRNVYRSSLLRLESLESVHAEALRATQMEGVIAFAKGRALERLRAFDLAAEEYRLAADLDRELAVEAGRSADLCEALQDTTRLGISLDDLADPVGVDSNADSALAGFERRSGRLENLERVAEGTHHVYVVREEIERTDMARADYFVALRQILPDGDVRAAAELQRLVTQHRESKYINRHILAMAEFYEELAVEYVDANPPESLHFDPVRFQELIEATSRLYEVVAGQDGKPEKLEAARKLEAFLAFALRVDRDRFMP
jgi:tetratricopeptide (TPR) repeat protein